MYVIETSYRWVSKFNNGQLDLEDKQRPGATCTASSDELLAKKQFIVTNDDRFTILQLANSVVISSGTISNFTISKKHIGLRKVRCKMDTYNNNKQQQQQKIAR